MGNKLETKYFKDRNVDEERNREKETLLETKSIRSSALAEEIGWEVEERDFQRSVTVDGVADDEDCVEPGMNGSIDLLKHQFLPFTGKTTNLAVVICLIAK